MLVIVILKVTLKKISKKYTQRNDKGFKMEHYKELNTKESNEGDGEQEGIKKYKEQIANGRSVIINYFKYKWIKFSNQKTRDRRMKTYVYKPTVCCLEETQFSFKDPHRFKVKG